MDTDTPPSFVVNFFSSPSPRPSAPARSPSLGPSHFAPTHPPPYSVPCSSLKQRLSLSLHGSKPSAGKSGGSMGRTMGRGGQAEREAAPSGNLNRDPWRQAKPRAGLPERGPRVRAHLSRMRRCCKADAHTPQAAQAQVRAASPPPFPGRRSTGARRARHPNGAAVTRAPWLRCRPANACDAHPRAAALAHASRALSRFHYSFDFCAFWTPRFTVIRPLCYDFWSTLSPHPRYA